MGFKPDIEKSGVALKILCLADEPDLTKQVEKALRGEDLVVWDVSGGEIGLEKIVEMQPDLVILSLLNPASQNWEVQRRIRRSDSMKHLPILLITDPSQRYERTPSLIDLPFRDDYLPYPFTPDELQAAVGVLMAQCKNLDMIAQTLERIQTEGEDISGNVAIFIGDDQKNYFVQFAAGHDDTPHGRDIDSLYAESSGNAILMPEFALTAQQIARLQAMGWKPPRNSPNFYRTWKATHDEERMLIAQEVLSVFLSVYHLPRTQPISLDLMIA